MNIFRLVGDLSHLAAIIILLLKIWKSRSCAGKSSPMAASPAWLEKCLEEQYRNFFSCCLWNLKAFQLH